ncbi:MAG: ABC transporter permease [Acidobacteria bacterium]|nr:ABC transporter permease [Acidobacteriota bacterium]
MTSSSPDSLLILRSLISKDFKVRYRNMSLGIFWSLVNPLVMMGVLTFCFTRILKNDQPYFPLFVLMGLLPFNFFTLAWASGANSVIENTALVKKVPFRRELLPISVVLANALHYVIQLVLLLLGVCFTVGVSTSWAWLPLVLLLQIVFVCGMALLFSALDVYFRDTRYIIESTNLVMFWLVPIFYSFENVAPQYAWIYELNPIAAVILLTRTILLDGVSPNPATLGKLAAVSVGALLVGGVVFRRIERNFTDYL